MSNEEQKNNTQKQTRYQRVKQILNDAQGDACPSYQGYQRFWELPLEQFLEVTIYGVRMIAPEGPDDVCDENMPPPKQGHSCCSSEPEPPPQSSSHSCCDESPSAAASEKRAASGKRSRGRGAASGLIKGLKGQFPFDGTQFP